jgi:UDP-N-acetylmuramoyl-tripeptide--D-alanyl-D-alanine ligase
VATPIPNNRAPFTLNEVLSASCGELQGSVAPSAEFTGVSTDTRSVTPASIFVAIRGERFDGHMFAAQAAEQGAALLLVEEPVTVATPQVIVANTVKALGALAALHRRRWGGAVLAIAGAAGKTTTRCVASALLEAIVGTLVHSTVGNLNNQIGVPMVLLGLEAQHRYAVVEVGTNQLGEVPALTDIVQPDVSLLTLVDLEHTEGLVSLDAIEQEEGAIFGPSCHTLVVNGDDERATRQALAAAERTRRTVRPQHVVKYGTRVGSQWRLVQRDTESARLSKLTLESAERRQYTLSVGLVGAPAAYAVVAAVTAVEALLQQKLSEAELQRGLESDTVHPEGRAEMIEGPMGSLIINDSYNANPASMLGALQTATELMRLRAGKLHLVLGEMRELGALSESAHRALAAQLQTVPWSSVFAIGPEMSPLMAEMAGHSTSSGVVRHAFDTAGIAQQLRQLLGPGDVVLVKGSRGVRTEKVIAELVSKVI